MKILLLGATGYIGSVVAEELRSSGHTVVPLVRTVEPLASGARSGDLTDPASLTAAVTADIDAVLNVATPTGDAGGDAAAAEALLGPLRETNRALVYTSGIWVLGATGDAPVAEGATPDPIEIVGYRPKIERQVLEAAAFGVRSSVIRPGIVYGRGGGIPSMLVAWAHEHGTGRYVGGPATRWPMVHVDDLAALFTTAVEAGPAGAVFHGVTQEAVPVAALAAAADVAAGGAGRAEPWPVHEAAEVIGAPFAEALALDQCVSGGAARAVLDWRPVHLSVLTDLIGGSYLR